MKITFTALSLLVSAFHFFFMLLESFLWTKPLGLKVFRMTAEGAEASKVLAFNQGFYNGILAAGILWGILRGDTSITLFCLVAVVIAALVGGYSVSYRIFFIQGVPALLALIIYFLMNKQQVAL